MRPESMDNSCGGGGWRFSLCNFQIPIYKAPPMLTNIHHPRIYLEVCWIAVPSSHRVLGVFQQTRRQRSFNLTSAGIFSRRTDKLSRELLRYVYAESLVHSQGSRSATHRFYHSWLHNAREVTISETGWVDGSS